MAGLGDVRHIGSGNIGATNVLRTGNKKLAAATLLLDGGKGALAVYFAQQLLNNGSIPTETNAWIAYYIQLYIAAIAVVLGHIFPIWLHFKGGKGVATVIGALLVYHLYIGLCFIGVWIAVFYISRISSLAALSAATLTTAVSFTYYPYQLIAYLSPFFKEPEVPFYLQPIGILLPFTLLLFYTHRANIRRLLAGTEPKFGRNAA